MTRAELIALGFPKEWINTHALNMTRAELVTNRCDDCGAVLQVYPDARWRLQLHRCRCEACAEEVTNAGYTEWESHYVHMSNKPAKPAKPARAAKMAKPLQSKIERFLAVRRKSSGGGWAEVNDGDMLALKNIIEELIKAKFQADADGDYPIQFALVNRREQIWSVSPRAIDYKPSVPDLLGMALDMQLLARRIERALEYLP